MVSRWENGKHFPSNEYLKKMPSVLGCQRRWLLGLDENSEIERNKIVRAEHLRTVLDRLIAFKEYLISLDYSVKCHGNTIEISGFNDKTHLFRDEIIEVNISAVDFYRMATENRLMVLTRLLSLSDTQQDDYDVIDDDRKQVIKQFQRICNDESALPEWDL